MGEFDVGGRKTSLGKIVRILEGVQRNEVMTPLTMDDHLRRFYHNWSFRIDVIEALKQKRLLAQEKDAKGYYISRTGRLFLYYKAHGDN